jgi:pimeloyl-ACP methyl ester carboxylesterase
MSTMAESTILEGFTESGTRYVQRGTGPDVLLIGGLTDVVESWQPQLDGLTDRYRITTYDNRGFGQSSIPMPGEPFTMATMVDDAVELLDLLGIERAHVGGFSGGGAVAQQLAISHPERVRSLVLNGTFDHMDAHQQRLTDMWCHMMDAASDARTLLEDFFTFIYSPAAHESGWVDAAIDEVMPAMDGFSVEAVVRSLDAYRRHDAREGLRGVDVPALVLAGQYDMTCPPRVTKRVADLIPGARFEVLPGAGHQQFQEEPELWNGKVDAFWRAIA